MNLLVALAAISFSTATSFASLKVSFDELRSNPSRYDGKIVTVKGLWDGSGGERNYFFRDARAARRMNDNNWMTVLTNDSTAYPGTNMSNYSVYDLRFVEVTGRVTTHFHSVFGPEPVAIMLQHLRVLPGGRQKQLLLPMDQFRNETPRPVFIEEWCGGTGLMTEVGPGEVVESFTGRSPPIRVTIKDKREGKVLSKASFAWREDYFDSVKRYRYFSITTSGIHPVPPEIGRTWKLAPTPDRD
ncbi:MAG: hypothetical protein M3119_06980 [Verrucomicrobiota bacterium]|nr:hypothetical protein [Verrucomicrobiota bacterium]MDQ6939886.1 hypothetical protein [Verrucomicrobiota bacterium]